MRIYSDRNERNFETPAFFRLTLEGTQEIKSLNDTTPNFDIFSFLFQFFVTFDLLWYCSHVCLEICNATGWYLFKINQTATNASNNATTSTNSNSTQRKNNR